MTNAILMASGLGTRMRPITETTPKPLIKIGNKPMIETIIDALQKANINNIYIVVGYLAEQFEYLTEKYSNVVLIKNPDYEMVNNISSIYYAKEELKKDACFICEADLYISDSNTFHKHIYNSCYFGKFEGGYSDDWVFDVGNDGYITRVGKMGSNQFNMVGISYFTKDDATILAEAIDISYGEKGYETLFWDDVVNNNLDKLKLKIYPVEKNQIVEIDTIEELNKINQEAINGNR